MKSRYSVLLCLLLPLFVSAQWYESFNDGHLNLWTGDVTEFKVNQENQLNLFAGGPGESSIFRSYRYSSDSMIWTIYCKLLFNPSASNKLKIYLAADVPNPIFSDGYYLEIGENGNEDRWLLYARQNKKISLLGSGIIGKFSSDPVECRFSIKRMSDTLWLVSTDYTGDNNFMVETEIYDSIQLDLKDSYFGIHCYYTETRKDKFIFDDIGIRVEDLDTIAPYIIKAEVLDDSKLKIEFNEFTNELQTLNVTNYSLDSFTHPLKVDKCPPNDRNLILTFDKAFEPEKKYRLFYKDIQDISGNQVRENQYINFNSQKHYPAKSGEILINEFMADPSPTAGLPETEFIELLNISGKHLQLKNLSIADGSSISENFPDFIIEPDSFILIYHKADSSLFKNYGKGIGLSKFPTINNSEEILRLFDASGDLIHQVNFSDSWYQNSFKKNGGYSLELKKPLQFCKGSEVWGPTEHILGGTPGIINTGYDKETDQIAPELITYAVSNSFELELIFNESLDPASVEQIINFRLNNDLVPTTANLHSTENSKVILFFDMPLVSGNKYLLNIKNLADCSGNSMSEIDVEIYIPGVPELGDLSWNEILFNPESGGEDFVELYNKSNKAINIRDLYISNPLSEPRFIKINSDYLLLPQSYVALTRDKESLINLYPYSEAHHIVETEIPSFDDQSGCLLLAIQIHNSLVVIDSLQYSQDWHNPLLINKEGVSLEKINPSLLTANKNHWQSASSGVKYATPGIQNSQYLDEITKKNKPYNLSSIIISPDQDGYRDFLSIEFNLELSGYKIRAEIYDLFGQLIRVISHQILGPHELLKWNGIDKNEQKIPSGNYILSMQLIHPEGSKHVYKELIVVDNGKK